jgi:DNA-binding NtrC family response regulator
VIRRIGSQRERDVDCRVIAATNRDSQSAVRGGALREDLYYRLSDFPLRLPPLRERPGDIFLLAQHFLADLNSRHGNARRFTQESGIKLQAHAWPGNVRELKQIVARAYLLADGEALRVELPEHRTLDHAEQAGSVAFRVGMSFEEVEQRMLRETLRYFGNDKARAAAALGISLKTIYNRLARCGAGGVAAHSRNGMASAPAQG